MVRSNKSDKDTALAPGRHRPRLSRMLRILNILGILLIVLVIAAASYVRIAPVHPKPVDFASLKLADSPNQYLVCPMGFCKNATAHRESSDFEMPSGKLLEHWIAVGRSASRTKMVGATSAHGGQVTFVQRSRWMAYPDIITIAVLPRGNDKSSFSLYSRSVYGEKDFGVNKERIDRWIVKLQNRIAGTSK